MFHRAGGPGATARPRALWTSVRLVSEEGVKAAQGASLLLTRLLGGLKHASERPDALDKLADGVLLSAIDG